MTVSSGKTDKKKLFLKCEFKKKKTTILIRDHDNGETEKPLKMHDNEFKWRFCFHF